MNQHVGSIVPFRRPLEAMDRDDIVKRMAEHLMAAILHDALDTSSDVDVIECLWDAPDRFNQRLVLDCAQDALYLAKQTLMARAIGDA